MAFLWIMRVSAFAATLVCAVIVLSLSAKAISVYSQGSVVPAYVGLDLAVAIITFLTIAPMLAIDLVRRGAITSWVIVELPVVGVLWILWIAAAAQSVSENPFRIVDDFGFGIGGSSGCSVLLGTEGKSLCDQQKALEAFGFLGWLALFGYAMTLLVFSLIASSRGNSHVWKSTVRDTNFLARPGGPDVIGMKGDYAHKEDVLPNQAFTPANAQQYQYQQQLYAQKLGPNVAQI